MSVLYRFEFVVSEFEKAKAIMEVLSGECVEFSMVQESGGPQQAAPSPAKTRRNKPPRDPQAGSAYEIGRSWILQRGQMRFATNKDGELAQHLKAHGFEPTSVSSLCTQLERGGCLIRVGRGWARSNLGDARLPLNEPKQ